MLVNTSTNWEHFEDTYYNPANIYAATKKAFEDILQYYVEAHELQAITLELTDTYGQDDNRRKIINLLIEAIRTDTVIEISPGEQLMDLVHVDDVIDAYIIACSLCKNIPSGHRRYSVSSSSPIKLKDIVALLERISGKEIPVVLGGREYRFREVMRPWLQGEPLPGWKCSRTLETFLAQQITST
jgi:nucleoside-diphosphate-sugar epimerase